MQNKYFSTAAFQLKYLYIYTYAQTKIYVVLKKRFQYAQIIDKVVHHKEQVDGVQLRRHPLGTVERLSRSAALARMVVGSVRGMGWPGGSRGSSGPGGSRGSSGLGGSGGANVIII